VRNPSASPETGVIKALNNFMLKATHYEQYTEPSPDFYLSNGSRVVGSAIKPISMLPPFFVGAPVVFGAALLPPQALKRTIQERKTATRVALQRR
jgi:hypothetical protein